MMTKMESDKEAERKGTNAGSFLTRDVTVLRRSCALSSSTTPMSLVS